MSKLLKKSTMAMVALSALLASASIAQAEEVVETTDTTTVSESEGTSETPQAVPVSAMSAAVVSNEPVEGQEVDVRVLATTDLHTNLVNYDYYQDKPSEKVGLAKTAVLIEEARKENANVVLLDNGDTIQGTPLGTYKAIVAPIKEGETHPMYAALEKLNYDAATLGNHEFNYGLEYLNKVIQSTNLPLVNANVYDTKTKELKYTPYTIITKQFADITGKLVDVKIGITGIVPPQILNWDKANLEGIVEVQDSVQAIQAIVPKIRQAGADLVVVLSHSGIGDDKYEVGEENVGYQIAGVEGVDVVVTGHSHAEFPSGKGTGFYEKLPGVDGVTGKINGTPVVMAGKYGDHLGVIDLKVKYENGKWTIQSSQAAIRKIDDKSDKADERVLEIAKAAHEKTIEYVRQQVGTTTAPITSFFALVKDDPSIQIVNNAQLWYAKQELAGTPEAELPLLSAAAPFKAGTRGDSTAYTNIPAGPIAIKNVADLYLYDNVTAILKVTGAQLKEWLEMSAGQFNTIDPEKKEPQMLVNPEFRTYNFDVIDGVTYKIDVTQPNKYDRSGKVVNENANRIKDLRYNGQLVEDTQAFIVVSNNYRAYGTFPGVKDAEIKKLLNLENRQAIINYIVSEKNINPTADNNWTFADTIKGLDLRFMTAQTAKELIGTAKDVEYVKDSENGFGNYRYIYTEKVVETPQPSTNEEETTTVTKDDKGTESTPTTSVMPNKPVDKPTTSVTPNKPVDKPTTQVLSQSAVAAKPITSTPATQLPQTGEEVSTLVALLGGSLATVGMFLTKGRRKSK